MVFGQKKDLQLDLRSLETPGIVLSLVSWIFDLEGWGKPEKSSKGWGVKEDKLRPENTFDRDLVTFFTGQVFLK